MHHFVLAKLATSSIRAKGAYILMFTLKNNGEFEKYYMKPFKINGNINIFIYASVVDCY